MSKRVRDIYVAVTHTADTMDNTGIQRVTRCLCRGLELDHSAASFVSWNPFRDRLEPIYEAQAERLSAYCGPQDAQPKVDVSVAPSWISHLPIPRTYRRKVREAWRRRNAHFDFRKGNYLIIPEWVSGEHMHELIGFAKKKKLKTIAIFHDAIAIDYPDLVSQKFRDNHMAYLKAMTHCDLVLANSSDSYERFLRFIKEDGEGKPIVDCVELAGEIPNAERTRSSKEWSQPIMALCVGSLDPRKNHKRLIEAFEQVWQKRPELDLRLSLVGGQYDAASDLSQWVESKVKEHPKLIWRGRVSDDELSEAYSECHFTCFPSLVEGFGIPLLESLWKGRPCLCSDSGIVGVLSQGGGCVQCDVKNIDSIASAIEGLVADSDIYLKKAKEAIDRPIKTWRTYSKEVVESIEKNLGGKRS